jgi:hypothetical protein
MFSKPPLAAVLALLKFPLFLVNAASGMSLLKEANEEGPTGALLTSLVPAAAAAPGLLWLLGSDPNTKDLLAP